MADRWTSRMNRSRSSSTGLPICSRSSSLTRDALLLALHKLALYVAAGVWPYDLVLAPHRDLSCPSLRKGLSGTRAHHEQNGLGPAPEPRPSSSSPGPVPRKRPAAGKIAELYCC